MAGEEDMSRVADEARRIMGSVAMLLTVGVKDYKQASYIITEPCIHVLSVICKIKVLLSFMERVT